MLLHIYGQHRLESMDYLGEAKKKKKNMKLGGWGMGGSGKSWGKWGEYDQNIIQNHQIIKILKKNKYNFNKISCTC